MTGTIQASRCLLLTVVVACLLASAPAGRGDEFGVTAVLEGSNVCVEFEVRTDCYYRVMSSPSLASPVWSVREMQLGEESTQSWNDVGVLSTRILGTETQQQYYKVGRVWLTNSLDFDADGLGDAYELGDDLVDPYDPDSDSDGVVDGDEANFFGTSPRSPYNHPAVFYTFTTNLQGWTNDDWGDGRVTMAWTNIDGRPSAGSLYVEPPFTGTEGFGQFYIKDHDLVDNQDVRRNPVYQAYVYVPSGAPLPPGDAVYVQLFMRSSSSPNGWNDYYYGDLEGPTPGEWTLLSWDMSPVGTQVLADVDEWGMKLQWNGRTNFHDGILIDTVHVMPVVRPTNVPPDVTSVTSSAASVGRYQKIELTVGLTNVAGLNPYDPCEVDLRAVFRSPSGTNWYLWGFYMEDEDDDWTEGSWRVRFAPNEVGAWSYSVNVGNRYGTNYSSTSTFTCVASEDHGWLRVSDDDPHYFEQDDDTPFVGIGYCHCWDGDDEGIFANCAEHGINMLHWWLAPWDTLLTIEAVKDSNPYGESSTFYTYEQGRARELDRIIGCAEDYGVKFVFTIWPHDAIRDFNYHKWRLNGSWQEAFDTKISEPEHYINAFSRIDDPAKNQKFFYDPKYWRFQEQLYRYIIARWGYSEAIGCWALVSEMFGTFANSLNCMNYQDPLWVTNKNAMFGENPYYHMDPDQCDGRDYTIRWLTAINSYFKNNDPFEHPTTASYGTDEYWDDGFPVVDVPQIHTYCDLYNWVTPPLTLDKYHRFLRSHYDKPSFMGEIGTVDWKHFEPDYTRVTAWPGLFTGGAITPMMWTTPAFSWYGDAKMGPWLDSMSDEIKVLAEFVEDVDFHRLGLDHADVETKQPDEPAVTIVESFEGGLNGWAKWGDGVASIGLSDEHATHGSYSLLMNVDMDTYDAMPNPESGISKYEGDGFSYDWTNYWPYGTLKMDLHIPEFYHPDENPDGFLLGVNKDPRSIMEIHCRDAGSNWRYYSTTNEYAADNGWKKLTVGMTWHLELPLGVLPTEHEAGHITGLKFWFGDVGILRGPVWIDNITVGRYAYNTVGLISSNGQFAFAWIQDRRWTNTLTASNAQFRINGLDPGVYNMEWWSTLDGPVGSFNAAAPTGTLTATAPDFVKDIAVKIRKVCATGATNRDVAVAAVREVDWMLRATTQRVDVLVVNQGTTAETFNVTLTDVTDAKVIGTNTVTGLGAGSNATSSFTWDCTNATLGFHTLCAAAAAVPAESDLADNTNSGVIRIVAAVPPWDSCDRLRRWKVDSVDTDGRILQVSTNQATEGAESFYFWIGNTNKGQAYFGFDNLFEDWSNKTAFVYDLYNAGSATNAQVLMRTGPDWHWYFSEELGIGSGWNTNLTFHFRSNVWTHIYWVGDEAVTNHNVQAGGLEEMQQISLKVTGYTNIVEGDAVYVDNVRLAE